MVLLDYLIKYVCRVVYFFFKFKKINKNKILFISRMSDDVPLDFKLIEESLKESNSNLKCVFLCKRITSFTSGFFSNIKYTLGIGLLSYIKEYILRQLKLRKLY